jgi:uncharacterized protein YyaL (SSP411 family)
MTQETPRFTNRLIKEKSPYLLMHAHNPVDWYPWGDEAFAEAKTSDKPIFLSIGYATCHWCHTMERECFENEEIAQLLNQIFVNIKVDREELPEIDSLYMEFAQSMMAGAAGWPLNVLLTPELEPFFATTYLPPESRHGLMGLSELIIRIQDVWHSEERDKLILQAAKIVEVFTESERSKGELLPTKESIDAAAELLFKMADPVYGGIKGMPKFPIGYQTSFLIRYSSKSKDSRALFLADRTLEMMYRGGIYDHLGGGFARYSVDEKWLVPHFEKMLYDNAILVNTYLEAWQFTKRPLFRQICEETINYVLRDMTDPQGGFYSAEDSESEGHEGYFYTWTFEEIHRILGPEEATLFCQFYNVTETGNFEGRNILNIPHSIEEFAGQIGQDPAALEQRFAIQRQLLWKVREGRIHPLKDDKVITSWNGMMIHAMALAGTAFEMPHYLAAAEKAAKFIKKNLWTGSRLLRRWREGETQHQGVLDDYAFMTRAAITLFEITGNKDWLKWALEMSALLQSDFKEPNGAFYQTHSGEENIILRRCQLSDGAEPSGNAIHCENLLKLYQLTGDPDFLNQAEDVLKAIEYYLANYSPGYIYSIMNVERYYDRQAPTFVIALNQEEEYRLDLLATLYKQYLPHKAVIWRQEKDTGLYELISFAREQPPIDGSTTLYVCREGVCEKPLVSINEMNQAITKL